MGNDGTSASPEDWALFRRALRRNQRVVHGMEEHGAQVAWPRREAAQESRRSGVDGPGSLHHRHSSAPEVGRCCHGEELSATRGVERGPESIEGSVCVLD